MVKFLAAAADPGSPIAAAMKLALADRRPMGAPGSEIGLAWIVSKPDGSNEILRHDGGTGGFRTSMAIEPAKRRGVVVLTNAAVEPSSDDLAMHLLIGTPVLDAGTVPPAPPPAKPRTAVRLPPAELDRVVGVYEMSGAVSLRVWREGDGLKAQLTGGPALPIFAEGPLDYFWRVVDAQVRFTRDAAGKVTGATLSQDGRQIPARRAP